MVLNTRTGWAGKALIGRLEARAVDWEGVAEVWRRERLKAAARSTQLRWTSWGKVPMPDGFRLASARVTVVMRDCLAPGAAADAAAAPLESCASSHPHAAWLPHPAPAAWDALDGAKALGGPGVLAAEDEGGVVEGVGEDAELFGDVAGLAPAFPDEGEPLDRGLSLAPGGLSLFEDGSAISVAWTASPCLLPERRSLDTSDF